VRPVSAAWLRTITGSHTPVVRATFTTQYQTGTSPVGTRVPIVDGSVTLDGSADFYTTGTLVIPGEYWPDPHGDSVAAPYGTEVYLERGIRYSDDLVEYVGLGYLRVRRNGQENADLSTPVECSLEDRMSVLARAKLLAPVAVPASYTYGQLAAALVLDVFPDAEIEWDDDMDSQPIGRDIVVESDRVGALKSLALSAGKVVRWDHRGVLVFFSVPDPLDARPVATLRGGRDGTLAAVKRELSDTGVVNAIVARGEGADEVGGAYAVAIDNDPLSPTRYSGPYGPSVEEITSSLITSDDQALIAAEAGLRRGRGLPYALSLEVACRPELEPDDLVYAEHGGALGLARHIISTLEIPLLGSTMSGQTRLQYLAFRGAN
jgi:hypothetical protein